MTPLIIVIMCESSSICGDLIAYKLVQHSESEELDRVGCDLVSDCRVGKVDNGVSYRARRNMILHMRYICWKDTCIFMIFYCIRILQLS